MKKIIYLFLILLNILSLSACSDQVAKKSDPVHEECFELDKAATNLHLAALASGEEESGTVEWQKYNEAKERFSVLNCVFWFTLSYKS